jgi:hypothetical protein
MTDDQQNQVETGERPINKGQLKKGYDPRRWIHGRPKKPADQKKAEDIVLHVIWEELSREIENPNTKEAEDALRLMVRSMIRNKQTQAAILDRIAGKVKQDVDITSEGKSLVIKIVKASDDRSTDQDK